MRRIINESNNEIMARCNDPIELNEHIRFIETSFIFFGEI